MEGEEGRAKGGEIRDEGVERRRKKRGWKEGKSIKLINMKGCGRNETWSCIINLLCNQ